MKEKRKQVVQNACQLLGKSSMGWDGDHPRVEPLAGDGSQRTFYRLRFRNGTRVVAIAPSDDARQGKAEARSAWDIGKHLWTRGIPVPEYFAYDAATGLILAEDIGDTRLYEYVTVNRPADDDILAVYRLIVHELIRMQVRGAEGFQPAWCYQTPLYDRRLMLERESGYFMESLCHGLLQMDVSSPVLQREFEDVADRAAAAPVSYFLHRDFQSRNIMLQDGRVRIIDFQGGRFGPLGYDLASLLIDPYTAIPDRMQKELLAVYLEELGHFLEYDPERFKQEYFYLSLQRNLQILGAFAFLSRQRGKMFFAPFIRPALDSLRNMLAHPVGEAYPALAVLVDTCLRRLAESLQKKQ